MIQHDSIICMWMLDTESVLIWLDLWRWDDIQISATTVTGGSGMLRWRVRLLNSCFLSLLFFFLLDAGISEKEGNGYISALWFWWILVSSRGWWGLRLKLAQSPYGKAVGFYTDFPGMPNYIVPLNNCYDRLNQILAVSFQPYGIMTNMTNSCSVCSESC